MPRPRQKAAKTAPAVPPFLLDAFGVKSTEELFNVFVTMGEDKLKEVTSQGIGMAAQMARDWLGQMFVAPSVPEDTIPSKDELLAAYQVLGVDPTESMEAINKVFRQRVFETHPDHNGDSDGEELRVLMEAMLKIRKARQARSSTP